MFYLIKMLNVFVEFNDRLTDTHLWKTSSAVLWVKSREHIFPQTEFHSG